jgi:diaminohydroxyphosphoribosylaminopyrimidine deaminase/5-amino-6-(5-phosphoribosylamino)uracil reductase
MVESARSDLLVATTSAGGAARRGALENRGVKVVAFDGPGGRVNLPALIEYLGRESYQSLMIEAGSKLNWNVLEAGLADKIFFYYAPKILGGLQSLPVAGGTGRRSRKDAIRFRNVQLYSVGGADEFAVEAYLVRED